LRTTNPTESIFAPVRASTELTKGPGIEEGGISDERQAFEEAAEGRSRKLTDSHLVALVRAAARFVNEELVEGSKKNEKYAA
jgi:hypothetical protein